jgi:hypothetical protein
MHQIIVSNEHRDLVYRHNNNGYSFEIDSRKIKEVLDYLPLSHPDVSPYIQEMIDENLHAIFDESQLFDNQ